MECSKLQVDNFTFDHFKSAVLVFSGEYAPYRFNLSFVSTIEKKNPLR